MRLKNLNFYEDGNLQTQSVYTRDDVSSPTECDEKTEIDCSGLTALPAFCDLHVHMREPGYEYKETIKSGTLAAAHGGYGVVCAMPNLMPAPDCESGMAAELEAIERDAAVACLPYAAITTGRKGRELTDFAALKKYAVAFSDDGSGVQDAAVMEVAMEKAAEENVIIAAHCEVESLLLGGYVHAGRYAAEHGHKGISSESEWRMIERDIRLADKTGCRYHVCHVSTKEGVSLILDAKKSGVRITAETAPHYLLLCEDDMRENGKFKMNPPLRSVSDRDALREALLDGTVDAVATDHAPHAENEKNRGLKDSLMGVVGLETAFPALYTGLVKSGIMTLDMLISAMSINPRRIFGIKTGEGFSVWNLDKKYRVDPGAFLSKGRSTPFEGMELCGENYMTVINGRIVWSKI